MCWCSERCAGVVWCAGVVRGVLVSVRCAGVVRGVLVSVRCAGVV